MANGKWHDTTAALPIHSQLLPTHSQLLLTHSQLLLTHSQLLLTHSQLLLTHSQLLLTHSQLLLTWHTSSICTSLVHAICCDVMPFTALDNHSKNDCITQVLLNDVRMHYIESAGLGRDDKAKNLLGVRSIFCKVL